VAVKPLKRQQPRSGTYEAEPNQQDRGWYENEVGRIVRLEKTEPPEDWEATLKRWPPRRD